MFFVVMYAMVIISCHAASIGRVNQTRFTSVDQSNVGAVWIHNQFSPKQCLCTVLSQYHNARLFNSYSNGSCQLLFSLPLSYVMQYNFHSTLILLAPLPPVNQAPCCSNLTWLVTRMQNSMLPTTYVFNPTYMVVDDLDYLAVMGSNDKLYRYNRSTMAFVSATWIAFQCVSVSYYNKQYFVGCGTNSASRQHVLSTATLTPITNISIPNDPRDVVFIRNGSMMIASVAGNSELAFYNVSSPTSYQLIYTLNAPGPPNSLYPVNDTFVYVTIYALNTPIFSLIYNETQSNWSWVSIPNTRSTLTSYNFQTTFDSCGRMWVSQTGYGIRIFDSTGTQSLYNWTHSTRMSGILMRNNFEFYAADIVDHVVYSCRPNLTQCTS